MLSFAAFSKASRAGARAGTETRLDIVQFFSSLWASIAAFFGNLDIFQLIDDYSEWFYLITFLWTFVEGETFVIIAGAAAAAGKLNVYLLAASAALGSFCGDQFYFFIGRKYGKYLLKRFPRWQPGIDASLGMLAKYHVGFILSFRFIYGVRNFASFAMGMSEVSWPRFFVLNFIAAVVWATIFAGSGYLLGRTFEHMLGDIAKEFGIAMLVILLMLISIGLWYNKRRKKTAALRAAGLATKKT